MVPGFSLFRRSSSLVAHPTTQGISLRGIGSTGASRTLVLWDGIPMNDPFGGWVYWTRFTPDNLSRVEVSRGSPTSVFGDRAMSGAITLFSREPEPLRLQGEYEFGNRNTHSASAGLAHLFGNLGITAQGRAFTTDGYFIVPERIRGPIDTPAAVRFVTGDAKLDYMSGVNRLALKLDVLAEDRANGTVLQNNSSSLGTIAANYHRETGQDGLWLLGYHTRQEFRSSFSAIVPGRVSENPTFNQVVPSDATGGAAIWRHNASRWNGLFGADIQRVEGYSTDRLFAGGQRFGGGVIVQHGVFGQTDFSAGPAKLFLGARHHFTGQGHRFFSPSAGATIGNGWIRGRASGYRSFRAPTLNELFREFRVGNAVTQANANLRPETMTGVETGFDVIARTTRVSVTAYRHTLDDLITNVTISTAPNLIIRQRRNAVAAMARGVEFDVKQRWRNWQGEMAYLFADSRFSAGERIPQVPKHQGSAQLSYYRDGTLLSFGMRSNAAQFEDDLNRFFLPGFAVAQVAVRQRLTGQLSATLQMENILNREFVVGFSPTPLIGAPRLWRAGLRWEGRLR